VSESRNHFAIVYDNFDERVSVVSRFLIEGLDRNERCVYIVHDREFSLMALTLGKAGIEIAPTSARGALLLTTFEQLDMVGFHPSYLLKRLHSELEDSVLSGFSGMRSAVEMTWALQVERPEDILVECEAGVEHLLATRPATHLCLFPRDTFRLLILSNILRTHPVVTMGGHTYDLNPFYESALGISTSDPEKRLQCVFAQLDRLQRLKSDGERLNAEIQRHELFLKRASHELLTPITTILGWCNLIEAKKLGSDNLFRALKYIKRNAELQNHLVGELLDACKLTSGKVALSKQPVHLSQMIVEFIESVAPVFKSKEVDLTCIVDASIGTIAADPLRLQQIMGNLLSNAAKFTPPHGRVSVTVQSQASNVLITVEDSGKGIKAELLPHIFDRFAQSNAGQGGLGLGLGIVRELVELHGGTVRVESRGEGRGTRVCVGLPSGEK
jgi:signal transduction histidine kinase